MIPTGDHRALSLADDSQATPDNAQFRTTFGARVSNAAETACLTKPNHGAFLSCKKFSIFFFIFEITKNVSARLGCTKFGKVLIMWDYGSLWVSDRFGQRTSSQNALRAATRKAVNCSPGVGNPVVGDRQCQRESRMQPASAAAQCDPTLLMIQTFKIKKGEEEI